METVVGGEEARRAGLAELVVEAASVVAAQESAAATHLRAPRHEARIEEVLWRRPGSVRAALGAVHGHGREAGRAVGRLEEVEEELRAQREEARLAQIAAVEVELRFLRPLLAMSALDRITSRAASLAK